MKIKGLRELSYQNSMSTTRSQNAVLQALTAEDLANVAMLLESGATADAARLLIEGNNLIGSTMSKSTISTFQLFALYPDEESARVYLEGRIWPSGPSAPLVSPASISAPWAHAPRARLASIAACRAALTSRCAPTP